MKKIPLCFLSSIFILFLTVTVSAHGGRTDSSGGHHDRNNVSGLGSYHYHHGYPAHLHENGICPYSSSGTNQSNKNQSGKSQITQTKINQRQTNQISKLQDEIDDLNSQIDILENSNEKHLENYTALKTKYDDLNKKYSISLNLLSIARYIVVPLFIVIIFLIILLIKVKKQKYPYYEDKLDSLNNKLKLTTLSSDILRNKIEYYENEIINLKNRLSSSEKYKIVIYDVDSDSISEEFTDITSMVDKYLYDDNLYMIRKNNNTVLFHKKDWDKLVTSRSEPDTVIPDEDDNIKYSIGPIDDLINEDYIEHN